MTSARGFRLRCGIQVSAIDPAELFAYLVTASKAVHICTVNPEITEWCVRDAAYRASVESADIRTIDGIGIAAAVFRQYGMVVPRFTGVQLVQCLADFARERRRPIVVIGAEPKSRERFEARLRETGVPVADGISPVVTADGSMVDSPPLALPREAVVLVALGVPKQERWIRHEIAKDPAQRRVYVGIGGAVDYLSGATILAPSPLRRLGLEWLFRLMLEPRKRIRRQISTLPRFFLREIVALPSR